jgi:hypothetical protein
MGLLEKRLNAPLASEMIEESVVDPPAAVVFGLQVYPRMMFLLLVMLR